MRPELSVDENYRRLCFLPRSLLFREFSETFSEVFGARVTTRGRILRLLLDGGLSSSELAEREGKQPNGSYADALRDLQLAGFVAEDSGLSPLTGKPVKQSRYRVKDNYARFYLKKRWTPSSWNTYDNFLNVICRLTFRKLFWYNEGDRGMI